MREYILLIMIAISCFALKVKGQCPTPMTYSLQITPASCSTCCDGSAQIVNFSGGCAPYSIGWSTSPAQYGFSASGLCAGVNYSVIVYDSGCCGSSMMICSMNYTPSSTCSTPITYSIQVTPTSCSGCVDGSAQVVGLQGGCQPYQFLWTPGGMSTGTVSFLPSGNYSVTVSDNGCCPSVTLGCFIPSGTATTIFEKTFLSELKIFPNPVKDVLNVSFDQEIKTSYSIEIADVLGKTLLFKNDGFASIHVSSLHSGIYFITLKKSGAVIAKQKFVKE